MSNCPCSNNYTGYPIFISLLLANLLFNDLLKAITKWYFGFRLLFNLCKHRHTLFAVRHFYDKQQIIKSKIVSPLLCWYQAIISFLSHWTYGLPDFGGETISWAILAVEGVTLSLPKVESCPKDMIKTYRSSYISYIHAILLFLSPKFGYYKHIESTYPDDIQQQGHLPSYPYPF